MIRIKKEAIMSNVNSIFVTQMEKLFGIAVSYVIELNENEVELYISKNNNDFLFLKGDNNGYIFSTFNNNGELHSYSNVYNEYIPAEVLEKCQTWYYNGEFISKDEYPTKDDVIQAKERLIKKEDSLILPFCSTISK
jgi:hypothetical protein